MATTARLSRACCASSALCVCAEVFRAASANKALSWRSGWRLGIGFWCLIYVISVWSWYARLQDHTVYVCSYVLVLSAFMQVTVCVWLWICTVCEARKFLSFYLFYLLSLPQTQIPLIKGNGQPTQTLLKWRPVPSKIKHILQVWCFEAEVLQFQCSQMSRT